MAATDSRSSCRAGRISTDISGWLLWRTLGCSTFAALAGACRVWCADHVAAVRRTAEFAPELCEPPHRLRLDAVAEVVLDGPANHPRLFEHLEMTRDGG